jgi:small subunit ribosomal protein S17
MEKTVVVHREYTIKVPKYERYKRQHSMILAHNPPCINAKIGDIVKIAECRPLSRHVHFVVIEKINQE